ncbi:hypothetical protein M413DRAFT_14778 [Hebeloma cylindrosporum]|uniref:Uncharacterized protein n=1 Tax=Hebeloma cylindrosporum TaxID=76867 RepID=A0A0C3BUI0_HEBCY|nr:hypothetical protein M413DRAFT_14778 [Hebeloma cylindrosporum h7]
MSTSDATSTHHSGNSSPCTAGFSRIRLEHIFLQWVVGGQRPLPRHILIHKSTSAHSGTLAMLAKGDDDGCHLLEINDQSIWDRETLEMAVNRDDLGRGQRRVGRLGKSALPIVYLAITVPRFFLRSPSSFWDPARHLRWPSTRTIHGFMDLYFLEYAGRHSHSKKLPATAAEPPQRQWTIAYD